MSENKNKNYEFPSPQERREARNRRKSKRKLKRPRQRRQNTTPSLPPYALQNARQIRNRAEAIFHGAIKPDYFEQTVLTLCALLRQDKGFTVRPVMWEKPQLLVPTEGYAVANLNWLVVKTKKRKIVEDVVRRFVADYWDGDWRGTNTEWLGAWVDPKTGYTHLDVVEVWKDLPMAIKVATHFNEIAVFNLDTGESVYVP